MGGSLTKSPLERRNTVVRRTQRKSIHHIKTKVADIMKDIVKFKGVEEDAAYQDFTARIESVRKELEHKKKDLQPQVRNIYNETSKKIEECSEYLVIKLKENQERAAEKAAKKAKEQQEPPATSIDNDVIIEEVDETAEEQALQQTDNKRKTVELNVIQIERLVAASPESKRASVMKMGVAVMPGSIMDAMHRESHHHEEQIAQIRKDIENLEIEISQFVGKRNGKHFERLKGQLEGHADKLQAISSNDEAIKEQLRLCKNYIGSCLSFLNEKAEDGDDEVFLPHNPHLNRNSSTNSAASSSISRTMKTTYI